MTDTVETQEVKKITQKITGWRIKRDEDTIEPITVDTPVQQPLTKLERGEVLYGATYKVKQPSLPNAYEHGFYITINSTNVSGELKPFELFIETKNVEALPSVNILSFTLTTLFRQQIDISHLLEEYKSIQVGGGYRGKKHMWQEKPKFYNSFWGEIADVIEYHLGSLNRTNSIMIDPAMEAMDKYLAKEKVNSFIEESDYTTLLARFGEKKVLVPIVEEPEDDVSNYSSDTILFNAEGRISPTIKSIGICPDCKEDTMVLRDGCPTCTDCGYSKCG